MNIAGMGIVSARGRGVATLEQALEQGWVPPVEVEVKGLASGRLPVYAISAETLSDKVVLAKARRADRFTRMAVLAAADALQDSGLGASVDKSRLGIIVATALGPHATTFSFLDGILDFGDAAVSPTAFSHSVHNAAASYIAMTLEVRGPTLTVTHFHFAFHQALEIARSWLGQGRCDAVLVGTVDELGVVMHHVCGRMVKPAADDRIKPFAFSSSPETVPGEGSAFFLMTSDLAGAAYGSINPAVVAVPDGVPSLQLLAADGLAKDEAAYRRAVIPRVPVAGYAPLFGGLLTGSAFEVAVAAWMLKKQRCYASPVLDNPHTLALLSESSNSFLDAVLCTKLDCSGRLATILLGRSAA
jgi:3-oxoacyl-[acyl-carrier-protein] synthase II